MLRASLLLPFALLACAGPSPPHAPPANPTASTFREERDWQQLPDADALRAEYGARDDFDARCEIDRPLREAVGLFDAESWPELLAVSDAFLTQCPVDIDFHFLQASALSHLDREAEADRHHQWRRALVESVLRSGRGDSAESPWIVISVPEEYAVLRALGMQSQGQSLLGGGIDELTVTVDGATRSVYFFPRAHWLRLRKQLGE